MPKECWLYVIFVDSFLIDLKKRVNCWYEVFSLAIKWGPLLSLCTILFPWFDVLSATILSAPPINVNFGCMV